MTNDIMTELTSRAEEINNLLPDMMPAETPSFGRINEAMRYSVLNGGKRLRGILLLESYRLYSNDESLGDMLVKPFAAAIECVHAYSLVHDDLPSMDNDMYRRGVLTTHAKYGHAMGVLTGDALLNYSFELISKAQSALAKYRRNEFIDEVYARSARASSMIYSKAGYNGMIGGQVLDVCETYSSPDLYQHIRYLMKLYELKTSRLFEAALCAGAVLGGADDEQIRLLEQYGHNIGIAFQIRDDILDIISTTEELGKDAGHDAACDKETVPALIGTDKASELVQKLTGDALEALNGIEGNTDFLRELALYLTSRNK